MRARAHALVPIDGAVADRRCSRFFSLTSFVFIGVFYTETDEEQCAENSEVCMKFLVQCLLFFVLLSPSSDFMAVFT